MANYEENNGKLKISEHVIEKIAQLATLEVDGVASISNINKGIKGIITKKYLEKPVKIDIVGGVANITVSVNVKYGISVASVSLKIQENIKKSVQNMTSITVSKVDVIISGIVFDSISANSN